MPHLNQDKRILAVDLRSRSFGFAVFEGPRRLLDWGVKSFRQGVNAAKIPAAAKFAGLMDEFSPRTVVLRKRIADNRKRAGMRRALFRQAEERRIPVRVLTRQAVKSAFVSCNRNKYTKQLPELAPRLPAKRKIWQPEDYRMSIFDAAALGVAYFSRGECVEPQESVPPPELSPHR